MLSEAKSASGGKNNNLIIMVLLVIVFTGVGFFAGTKYRSGQSRNFAAGQFGPMGVGGGNQRFGAGAAGATRGMRGGQVVGEVSSVDNNSVTVKMADGSSKIVILSNNTAINKASSGSVSDLTAGTKVAIFGSTNSDGTVTAQNVQINPIIRTTPSGTPQAQPQQ